MQQTILIGTSSFGRQDSAPLKLLTEAGLTVRPNPYGRKLTKDELIHLLDGVDGLLAGLETVDREVLTRSRLKAVSRCGAGISNVDVAACRELGIAFASTPFGPTQAVAELTLGMIIALLRRVFDMQASLATGDWNKQVGLQLKGKTVVIVGFGRIGQRTAALLAPFEVTLLAVDPGLDAPKTSVCLLPLAEALPRADVLVLHVSGDEQILGAFELARLKPGAFVCNAARGATVDEAALLAALNTGQVAGAWLDTFAVEPYTGPLCGHPRVLLTPHVGSYTAEGRLEMELEAARNLIHGLESFAAGNRL